MGKKVKIYTDGASRGNPGRAAIAFLIIDEDGNVLSKDMKTIGMATNNEAEYRAIIAALESALSISASEVSLTSDSEVVVNHLTGKYTVKAENLKKLFKKVKELERKFSCVSYNHVRRTNPFITMVDAMVNKALDKEYI